MHGRALKRPSIQLSELESSTAENTRENGVTLNSFDALAIGVPPRIRARTADFRSVETALNRQPTSRSPAGLRFTHFRLQIQGMRSTSGTV